MRTFIRKKDLTGSGTFNEAFANKESFMKIFRYFDFETKKHKSLPGEVKIRKSDFSKNENSQFLLSSDYQLILIILFSCYFNKKIPRV